MIKMPCTVYSAAFNIFIFHQSKIHEHPVWHQAASLSFVHIEWWAMQLTLPAYIWRCDSRRNHEMVLTLSGPLHLSYLLSWPFANQCGMPLFPIPWLFHWLVTLEILPSRLQSIRQSYLNGSFVKMVLEFIKESPKAMAIDWISSNLYFIEETMNRIEVYSMFSAERRVDARRVLIWDRLASPQHIAVHPAKGWVSTYLHSGWIKERFLELSTHMWLLSRLRSHLVSRIHSSPSGFTLNTEITLILSQCFALIELFVLRSVFFYGLLSTYIYFDSGI